jgi:putative PIN family toxin of toxin-antitoxin system
VAENLGKVVIDTDVLISAVVFGGAPERVLDLVRIGVLAGVTSLYILDEFRSVLMRPTFGTPLPTADALALEIAGFTEVMAVERAVGSWVDDPGDDAIVETALAAGATHAVTGDQMLPRTRVPGLRIVTVDMLLGLLCDRPETRRA